MELNPYIMFDGRCEEAFKFYEQVLGGKMVTLMTYAGSPAAASAPPEMGGKILHASLAVGTFVLMGSDCPPGRYDVPQGFQVSIGLDDPAKAERVFNALAEKGTVNMPLQQTFWAARFGMVKDRFGIPWMVNCRAPAA